MLINILEQILSAIIAEKNSIEDKITLTEIVHIVFAAMSVSMSFQEK